ncbi:MAG: hypothetical protein JWQ89_1041 [Devosia sp.]|uniref:hypothetical protein n=1 Tax=Devosia sp. TaxID=1871048 RepID=UPI0026235293|nr:hypothetical protein [Devosia sp.]MDB5539314.1 hypothetical protein [Devosia sp.]
MIPASYLYKNAYRRRWGTNFGRAEGEGPEQGAELQVPHSSALQTARDLFDRALGPRRGRQ